MKIGMLWLDENPSMQLTSRVERAASYYQAKYGRLPNTCVLHPETLGDNDPKSIPLVRVETSVKILPEHFWIGVEQVEKMNDVQRSNGQSKDVS
jgi:hypothetical protein